MNKKPMLLRHFLFNVIKPYKWSVGAILFMALYWGVYNALSPYVLKLIIDKVVAFEGNKPGIVSAVKPNVIFYVMLWLSIAANFRLLDWIKLKLFPSIRYDLITHMFAYLSQHSHRYFQNNFAGSLSNKILDMQSAAINIFSILDEAFRQSIGLCVALIALLMIHPIFALILLLWAISFMSVAIYFFKPIHELAHVFAMSKTSLVGKMVDSISNITNVRLFSRGLYENTVIHQATLDTTTKDRSMQKEILKMRIGFDASIVVLMSLNIWVLVIMYSKNQVSVGDFSFIITLSIGMFIGLWNLASQFVTFAEELGRCKQALSIISAPLDIVDSPSAKPLLVTKARWIALINEWPHHHCDCASIIYLGRNG